MNIPSYVPILKFKLGEQNALSQLKIQTKDSIIPLLELIPTANNNDGFEKKISSCWSNRHYYFDVHEDLYGSYFTLLEQCNPTYVIPVLTLDDDYDTIQNALKYTENGCALRIYSTDYERLDASLTDLVVLGLNQNDTDLIIDLKVITGALSDKIIVLNSLLRKIKNINLYRSVIISSSSFPENFNSIQQNNHQMFERLESRVHTESISLSQELNFKFVYSDYGIGSVDYIEPSQFMNPAFKIKYSTNEYYLCYKGLTNKNKGLSITNVSPLCLDLVNSTYFSGRTFSYGDEYIYNIAHNIAKSAGNNTTWVTICQNHHIELIVDIISNLP